MRKFEWLMAACCLTSLSLTGQPPADSKGVNSIGVVNINACVTDSRQGVNIRQTIELINQKAAETLQEIDKQIQDIDTKLSDEHFRDSLTAQAVEQMRQNHEKLLQDREIKSNEFRQQMTQTQMSVLQELVSQVSAASETVVKRKGLSIALSGEAITYYDPSLDITKEVVEELNKTADSADANSPRADKGDSTGKLAPQIKPEAKTS